MCKIAKKRFGMNFFSALSTLQILHKISINVKQWKLSLLLIGQIINKHQIQSLRRYELSFLTSNCHRIIVANLPYSVGICWPKRPSSASDFSVASGIFASWSIFLESTARVREHELGSWSYENHKNCSLISDNRKTKKCTWYWYSSALISILKVLLVSFVKKF